jgi:hypothetical protein
LKIGYSLKVGENMKNSISKSPIYTLGSPVPRLFVRSESPVKKTLWQKVKALFRKPKLEQVSGKFSYTAFSGEDIKVRFVLNDGTVRIIAELQAFSIKEEDLGIFADLIFIVFDRSSLPILKKTKHIVFYAANEYGSIASSYLKDISLVSYKTGISVDDLISEETILVKAGSFVPWTPSNNTEEERDKFPEEVYYLWLKQHTDPEIVERAFPKEYRDKYFTGEI